MDNCESLCRLNTRTRTLLRSGAQESRILSRRLVGMESQEKSSMVVIDGKNLSNAVGSAFSGQPRMVRRVALAPLYAPQLLEACRLWRGAKQKNRESKFETKVAL